MSLLLLVALAAVFKATDLNQSEHRIWGLAALCGAMVGASLLMRPTHVILAPAFGVAWLMSTPLLKDRILRASAFSLPVVLALGITFTRNHALFGDWTDFGYPETVHGGVPINTFDTPFFYGLYGLLLSPGKSLLLYCPVVIPGVMGLKRMWADRPFLAVAAGGPLLIYVLFYSVYGQWEGGYCYGPRYLFPALPLILLAAASLLTRKRNLTLLLACLAVGVITNLPAVMTSFLEEQRSGVTYYNAQYEYQISHGGFINQGKLMFRYLGEALQEGPLATPVTSGLDMGPIHLFKVSAAPAVVWTFILLSVGLCLVGGILLRRPER